MKRLILVLFIGTFIGFAGFAKDFAENYSYRFTNGGYWISEQGMAGGAGEYGFKLVSEKNNFMLRDCIYFEGMGGAIKPASNKFCGLGGIGNKLLIGGCYNCGNFIVRSYGYFGGTFDLFKTSDKSLINGTFLISTLGGGGFEFQFTESTAFFIEYGGNYRTPVGNNYKEYRAFSNSSPTLTIGYRGLR